MRIAGVLTVLAALSCGPAFGQYCASGDDACSTRLTVWEDALFGYEQVVGEALGPEAARCLAADSSRWNSALANMCLGDACRQAAYADRLSSLLVFLPEAGPVEGIDFVTTPQLVTILAPEAEAVDPDDFAPPDSDVFGQLSQASTDIDHMGLAIKDAAGDHVVVLEIDIGGQAGHDTIQQLIADEPGQRFMVRGSTDELGNFKAGQCRLIYRMPIADN